MRIPFCKSEPKFGSSVRDIEGFKTYNRFIVLSTVSSTTIPNILDLLFSLYPFGTESIPQNSKKTRVLVINTSEVHGSIHNISNTRNRNTFIHYGMADCDIDSLTGDTPIVFTDLDWNVIVDKPHDVDSAVYRGLTEVQLSYDMTSRGCEIVRNSRNNRNILIPSPEYYDETDMVMLGGRDESYGQYLLDLTEDRYLYEATSDQRYLSGLPKYTLNDLIDDRTKVYKVNIQIENLSSKLSNIEENHELNNIISEICCQLKYGLEHSGYSNAEIILNGKQGYNITFEKLRSYLNLSPIEVRTNFMLLCGEVNSVNEQYMCDQDDYSLLININHANIKVCIIDLIPAINNFDINTTDSNVRELGERLKYDNPSLCEFRNAMERDHSVF